MEQFNLEEFVENPQTALQSADKFRKKDWMSVAGHYGFVVKSGARKDEVREVVMTGLRDSGMITIPVVEETDPQRSELVPREECNSQQEGGLTQQEF